MIIETLKSKSFAALCILMLLAAIFSCIWIKAEEPVISDTFFVQTEDKQGIFPYSSLRQLNLDSGQIYSIRFNLKSLVDYQIIFKDKPISITTYFNRITDFSSDLSKPFELNLSLDLPDPLNQEIAMVLQSTGGENGFTIKPIFASNLHAHSFGLSIALIAVLLLFALQWKENFSALEMRIFYVILFLLFCFIFQYFCRMLIYELSGVFNLWDTSIYWSVGKGIADGIPPYTGLFEIKPPGIFVLSALSFYFFNSPILTNIVQVIVLIIIAIVPSLAYFLYSKKRSACGLALAVMIGLLLSLYSEERAGLVQVETFGAAFGAIAVLIMFGSFEKYKLLKIFGTALCMLISCGFKEPFLFPLLGASLIFSKSFKDWSFKFALPLAIALGIGILVLLLLGWFDGFLKYFLFMSGTHVSALGSSPLERAVYFVKIFDNLDLYSLCFGYMFICLFCVLLWSSRKKILQVLSLIAFLFLASLSVALGGEYFSHHFVFAVPFYIAVLIRYNANSNNKINSVLLVLLTLSIFNLPDTNWKNRSLDFNQKKINAPSAQITEYLDSVMEQSGIERFVNLCNAGYTYVFTCYNSAIGKHSPQGPYFLMDNRFFDRIPGYTNAVLDYAQNGQIAIYTPLEYMPIAFQIKLKTILDEYYTPIPWEEVKHIPKPENTLPIILFRKRN